MSGNANNLERYVEGKDTNSFGLHLIGTTDTKNLVNIIKDNIQNILNLAKENGQKKSRDEEVTIEIIEDYDEFKCGESITTLKQTVRGKHVYFFSNPNGDFKSGENSLNDKFMHDTLTLGTIKNNGAKTVNMVQLCVPYARQDKATPNKRQSPSIETIGGWISNLTGKDGYYINIDMHNPASGSAFKGTNFINLYTGWFIEEVIKDLGLNRNGIVLSSADQGGDKTIQAISKDLEIKNVIAIKTRDYSKQNTVEDIDIYGDIEGKDVIIHDDMLDTGGTMCKLLEKMLKKNPKSINVAVTHGMFNGEAFKKLEDIIGTSNRVIQNIYMTDSINKENVPDFIKTISLKNIMANTIVSIYKGLSINRGDNTDYTKVVK